MSKNHMGFLAADPEQGENSPAWRRAILRILEKRGKLARTGKYMTDPDGLLCPVYILVGEDRKFEDDYRLAVFEHVLDSLERKGLIRKTGDYRLGDYGFLYSRYVPVKDSGWH